MQTKRTKKAGIVGKYGMSCCLILVKSDMFSVFWLLAYAGFVTDVYVLGFLEKVLVICVLWLRCGLLIVQKNLPKHLVFAIISCKGCYVYALINRLKSHHLALPL